MTLEAGQSACAECRGGAGGGARPLLHSREVSPLQSPGACRARAAHLITQLVAAQDPLHLREFTSYFHGQAKKQPCSLITSHEGGERRPAVTMYPSLAQQTIKWLPYFDEISPPPPETPISRKANEKQSACRCSQCRSDNCSRRPDAPASALKKFLFKDNIMTFCNQETMTPKVNDVSCGICLGVEPLYNSQSVKVTTAKTKDDSSCPRPPRTAALRRPEHLDERNSRNCRGSDPRGEADFRERSPEYNEYKYDEYKYGECKYDIWPQVSYVRQDECNAAISQAGGRSSCFENCDYYPDFPPTTGPPQRRILYNEGISDTIANNLPTRCKRRPCPMELYTKVSTTCCAETSETFVIPYSHRGQSKYHIDCQHPPSVPYRAGREGNCEELRRLLDSPRPVRRVPPRAECPSSAPCRTPCRSPYVPKKMLSSEKNVGAFIFCPNSNMDPDD